MYRSKVMTARFAGTCASHTCSKPINPGDLIVHIRRGVTYHVDCDGRKLVTTVYFPSSGTTIYRNANGTCEDAPCCGCCTF